MEGFYVSPKEKLKPTDEPNIEKTREDKINEAQKKVSEMFEFKMANAGEITSFEYPRN